MWCGLETEDLVKKEVIIYLTFFGLLVHTSYHLSLKFQASILEVADFREMIDSVISIWRSFIRTMAIT